MPGSTSIHRRSVGCTPTKSNAARSRTAVVTRHRAIKSPPRIGLSLGPHNAQFTESPDHRRSPATRRRGARRRRAAAIVDTAGSFATGRDSRANLGDDQRLTATAEGTPEHRRPLLVVELGCDDPGIRSVAWMIVVVLVGLLGVTLAAGAASWWTEYSGVSRDEEVRKVVNRLRNWL